MIDPSHPIWFLVTRSTAAPWPPHSPAISTPHLGGSAPLSSAAATHRHIFLFDA